MLIKSSLPNEPIGLLERIRAQFHSTTSKWHIIIETKYINLRSYFFDSQKKLYEISLRFKIHKHLLRNLNTTKKKINT